MGFLVSKFSYQSHFLQQLHPSATIQETQQWLLKNRFSAYTRLFSNFSGIYILLFSFFVLLSRFCVAKEFSKNMMAYIFVHIYLLICWLKGSAVPTVCLNTRRGNRLCFAVCFFSLLWNCAKSGMTQYSP